MKKYEYISIEDGSVISPSLAVQQSCHILDLAGEIATDKSDVDAMLKVSRRWLEFGASLQEVIGETEDEKEESEPTKKAYGFSSENKSIIEKVGDTGGESGTDEN